MSSATVTLPDSPAGRQVGWLLGRVADPDGLTVAELAEHIHPNFLGMVGPEQLLTMVTGMGATLAGATIDRAESSDDHGVVALLGVPGGGKFRIECHVEPVEPHRIGMAQFEPIAARAPGAEPRPWSSVLAAETDASRRSDLPTDLADRVDALITTTRDSLRLPGLAVGVVDGAGQLVHWHGVGTAHLDPYRAPTPETVVRIGSISKTMTAIGALQLVESGTIDLDAPANNYLTSYQLGCSEEGAEDITLRHLLTHSSGIMPGAKDIGVDEGQPVPSLAEFYAPRLEATKKPKEAWSYSNDAFATVGQLIADVSGRPFADYMATEVFDRLGMAATSYLRDDRVIGDLFTGYVTEFDELAPAAYRDIIVAGAGSVFSTVNDMARYVAALLNNGTNSTGQVLSAETFRLLFTAQETAMPAGPMQMGLAFIVTETDGHRVVWHNGGWPGANSEMWFAPDDGYGVLAFTNTFSAGNSGKMDQFASELLGLVLKG